MTVKIEKVILADGKTVRWRARGVSTGRDPVTGRRTQRTITGRTKKEVEAEVRRIGAAVDRAPTLRPWDGTVNELCDSYLRVACRGREANTVRAYQHALRIPRQRLGQRRAMSISRDDIENLVDFSRTEGRSRGGTPGTGLAVATTRMMLSQLCAAFEQAVDDEKLARNPARKVRVNGAAKTEPATWSESEVRRFIAATSGERLAACWLLSALGLRRGEVCGLRWADVSLHGGHAVHQEHPRDGRRRGHRERPQVPPRLPGAAAVPAGVRRPAGAVRDPARRGQGGRCRLRGHRRRRVRLLR